MRLQLLDFFLGETGYFAICAQERTRTLSVKFSEPLYSPIRSAFRMKPGCTYGFRGYFAENRVQVV